MNKRKGQKKSDDKKDSLINYKDLERNVLNEISKEIITDNNKQKNKPS